MGSSRKGKFVLYLYYMKEKFLYLSFAIVAVLLFLYTFIFVNETHHFVLNAGWENNLIEAKWLFYLIVGTGICLWGFYHFFAESLFSEGLIYLHVFSFILLAIVLVLWDNTSFSLQEAVESQSYNSIEEIKSDYRNIMDDRTGIYRSLFWLLFLIQPIGLINLLLGFIRPKS